VIVTFYSYKGGTGRTMTAANIACLLAKAGRRVLVVDFDLEAPGVWRYFEDYQRGLDRRQGLIDLLIDQATYRQKQSEALSQMPAAGRWRTYTTPVRIGTAAVTLMTSGAQDDEYPARVLGFDWADFFAHQDGGAFFERLREEWNREYDFVLIDSRTGITDIGGICTILLPDLIVPVFTANWQNLEGVVDTLRRVQRGRQELAYDRAPALVLPVLSRFESRTELESANEWLSRAASMLGECYADWLPKDVDPRLVLERTKLPHIAYFGFGERLAVQLQGTSDPESLGYAYNTLARLIDSRLKDAQEVILGAEEQRTVLALAQRLEPPSDSWIADLHSYGARIGTGVVIDRQRVLIATHVLAGDMTSRVQVSLPRSENRQVRAHSYRALLEERGPDEGVSVFRLQEPLPPSVEAAPLEFPRARDLVGRRWWSFGFPGTDRLGAEASGTVGAALAYGSIRLDGGRRSFWRSGVSGAPVWSPDHRAVVAILLSVHSDGYGDAVTLAEVAADLPDARLTDLAVPGSGAGLDSQRRDYFIDALAKVFDTEVAARRVREELGLPPEDFAQYRHPRLYWEQCVTELENGMVPDGVSALAQVAVDRYPGNRVFRETSDYLRTELAPEA
jgi:cellulose biosynthesis protein BcsQ